MKSPHNAAARWKLHASVAEPIVDQLTRLNGFAPMREDEAHWRAFSAGLIEALRIELSHLTDDQLSDLRAACDEQRRMAFPDGVDLVGNE